MNALYIPTAQPPKALPLKGNVKVILLSVSASNSSGRIFKARTLPYDSITHYVYIDRWVVSKGDTVLIASTDLR